MIVTTSYDPDERQLAYAHSLCQLYHSNYVPRDRHTIESMLAMHSDRSLLLVTKHDVRYHQKDQAEIFFHPSLAMIRCKQLLRGETDALTTYAQVIPGDEILDCTAGLATDAMIFSYLTGHTGKVVALESELLLSIIVREGLRTYHSKLPELNEAMRNIHVVHIHHLDYLQKQRSQSVDIIYFDPMFRRPLLASSSLDPMRQVANHQALQRETINEARRVARKRIVMKENRNSREFARLGIPVVTHSNSRVSYGVIELGTCER
jgi:16S rRNA (guanine1516-N2)-methyltransferase